jgi:hypothetical protein
MAKPKAAGRAGESDEPGFGAAEYNRVVGCAQLLGVQVAKVRMDVDSLYYDPSADNKLNFSRSERGAVYEPERRLIAGNFYFEVSAKQARKRVLHASAEYFVIYELNAEVNEAAARTFCNRVGMFAAYPYFRALVAHLTWEANAKLPPLPVIATRGAPIPVATAPKKLSRRKS